MFGVWCISYIVGQIADHDLESERVDGNGGVGRIQVDQRHLQPPEDLRLELILSVAAVIHRQNCITSDSSFE
jgi:hypothetical protein